MVSRKGFSLFLIFLTLTPLSPKPASAQLCSQVAALLAYRQSNRRVLRTEVDNDWPIDAARTHTIYPYDDTFRRLLGGDTFGTFLEKRATEAKRPMNVLDLFGSGIFLRDLKDVNTITGVRLRPLVGSWVKLPGYPNPKWRELTGDLHREKTWRKIRASLETRGVPSVDLIVARPGGALLPPAENETSARAGYVPAHFLLLDRAYRLLSRDGGTMLLEIPRPILAHPQFPKWLEALRGAHIEAEVDTTEIYGYRVPLRSGTLKLRRTPDAPDALPSLPEMLRLP